MVYSQTQRKPLRFYRLTDGRDVTLTEVGFYIAGPTADGGIALLGEWDYAEFHGLGREGVTVVVTRADPPYLTSPAVELATTSEVDAVELEAMLWVALAGKIDELRDDADDIPQ